MTNVVAKKLENLDVTVIVDRSGSMGLPGASGKSRWEEAGEGSVSLASKAAKYDADGITLISFHSTVDPVIENATPARVAQLFQEREPSTSTRLDLALAKGFEGFFSRKTSGKQKSGGELFLVITDGEPDNRAAVKDEIIKATQKLDNDDELGILIVQIGNDQGAQRYLKELDDDLKGAKFDIVDTITMDEVGNSSLDAVLARAFED